MQLLLHLPNDAARTQIHNYLCQERGGYRQGYGRIEAHSFLLKRRERWRQGARCLRCLKLRRIDGVGGLTMAPRSSSGCGACIPELTTRRHRGRLVCLGSLAKASTLRGRHRRFTGGSVFHTSFRGLLSLLATQQKWYNFLYKQVVRSLIPHNYYRHQVQHISVAGQRLFITWKRLKFSRAHATRDSCGHLGSGPRCTAVRRIGVPSLAIPNQSCPTISNKSIHGQSTTIFKMRRD